LNTDFFLPTGQRHWSQNETWSDEIDEEGNSWRVTEVERFELDESSITHNVLEYGHISLIETFHLQYKP
jgi:hypothetical protein